MTDATQEVFDSAYEERIEREAEAAATHLRNGQQWSDWLAIGRLMQVGRNKAMLKAGTNEPIGARYNKAFGEWLDARQWLRDIDKATRLHAMWCLDHLEELTKLRENMGQTQRDRSNHPTVMRRAWDKWQREGEKAPSEKKESRAKVLERELEAVAAERDKWKHKAEKDGSLFDVRKDTAKQIAQTLRHNVTTYKLQELHKAIGEELKAAKALQKHAG